MRNLLLFSLFYFYGIGLCAVDGDTISVMTYNIRFAGDEQKEGLNHWNNRKENLAKIIRTHHADIIGVQEALKSQIDDLLKMFPEFSFVGEGRDGGENGEYSAILFNKNKFDVFKSSTFWLSETPDEISLGWDAQFNRVCSWAQFKRKADDKCFFFFNTHLDHIGENARTNSAKLIKQKIKDLTDDQPVILTGDFNFQSDADGYKILTGDEYLKDAQFISSVPHMGGKVSFNNFGIMKNEQYKIDFIFVNEYVKVITHQIDTTQFNGRFPSDHMPVAAEIIIQ